MDIPHSKGAAAGDPALVLEAVADLVGSSSLTGAPLEEFREKATAAARVCYSTEHTKDDLTLAIVWLLVASTRGEED